MKISHKILNIDGKDVVYIYVNVDDIYEFGKENLGKGENSNFLENLRSYVNNNLTEFKKAAAVIVINGVLLGTMTLASLYPQKTSSVNKHVSGNQVEVYNEEVKIYNSEQELKDSNKQDIKETNETKVEETKKEVKQEEKTENIKVIKETNKTVNTTKPATTTQGASSKPSATTSTNKNTAATTTKPSTTTSNKATTSTTNGSTTKKTQTSQSTTTGTKNTTSTATSSANSTNTTTTAKPQVETVSSGIKIKLNNGGVISNIDLEEYIIGVVAAEMPASFSTEALKAQAVAARTYAMKKHSQGITLLNSTVHQVYNTVDQMRSRWGSSFDMYYNKVKGAVESTKGQVLKYNGTYIEAAYYAVSNGMCELPVYVWNSQFPYLQAVSSSWDIGLAAAKHTVTMSYDTMSSKLGVTVNKDTEIKILSRTEGNRIKEISIGGKVFEGNKARSLLGLRSTDFTITQNDNNATIVTLGYGHGVGMSQYGANGAAKEGYSYVQILNHYYPGASLVNM